MVLISSSACDRQSSISASSRENRSPARDRSLWPRTSWKSWCMLGYAQAWPDHLLCPALLSRWPDMLLEAEERGHTSDLKKPTWNREICYNWYKNRDKYKYRIIVSNNLIIPQVTWWRTGSSWSCWRKIPSLIFLTLNDNATLTTQPFYYLKKSRKSTL